MISTRLIACLALAGTFSFACSSTGEQSVPPADYDPMAAMEQYIVEGQPGQHHRALEPMIGTFTAQLTTWMEPGAEPMTSSGTIKNEWICEGRFVKSDYKGNFADQAFSGFGLIGYDPYQECYVGTWVDSMSTMFPPQSHGTASKDGKKISMVRTWQDPIRKVDVTMREVITIHGNDRHTLDMYSKVPGEAEFKMMNIEYTRK